jgi:hypothetical protein
MTRSSALHHRAFLCSSVIGPKDMMMKSLAPCCHVLLFVQVLEVPMAMTTRSLAFCHCAFFCSNVVGPRDTYFVILLQVNQVHDDEFHSSS